jgi:hypothetical protein
LPSHPLPLLSPFRTARSSALAAELVPATCALSFPTVRLSFFTTLITRAYSWRTASALLTGSWCWIADDIKNYYHLYFFDLPLFICLAGVIVCYSGSIVVMRQVCRHVLWGAVRSHPKRLPGSIAAAAAAAVHVCLAMWVGGWVRGSFSCPR